MNYFKKYKLVAEETENYKAFHHNNPQKFIQKAREEIGTDINVKEKLIAYFLNNSLFVTGFHIASVGTEEATLLSIKQLASQALLSSASAVVLVHNHPSGNVRPSTQDIEMTKTVKVGLGLLDIKLLDHIIITKEKDYSMRSEGIISYEARDVRDCPKSELIREYIENLDDREKSPYPFIEKVLDYNPTNSIIREKIISEIENPASFKQDPTKYKENMLQLADWFEEVGE